jgi:non-ribosomal peptide synthetase component F
MMEDGSATTLVTLSEVGSSLVAEMGDELCVIELDGEVFQDMDDAVNPTPVAHAEDEVAYCIFTSGSTGRPKVRLSRPQ